MIYAISIIVYLLSAALMWRHNHLAYSKRGRWSSLKPDLEDLLSTFLPIFNTIYCVVFWLMFYPVNCKTDLLSKFFNIKK